MTILRGSGSPKIPTVEVKMALLDSNEPTASLPVASRHAAFQAALRTDFYSFVQAAFPIVSGGKSLQLNWHLEAMSHALTEVINGNTRRLIITVPPRSLKSICCSVALPAFALGHDPTRRIICVSYSEALARKHSNDCRALMHSPLYQRIFPRTRISPSKDTETEVMTTSSGSRLTTSVGGTLTGRGGNLLIIDDPLKPQDAHSESARESLKQWYSGTLLSRLDNKSEGAIIVVMQRLHPDDLVGHLLEQGGWNHLNLPAIAEAPCSIPLGMNRYHYRQVGDLLHPEREDQVALNELKRAMGSMEFAAQYQQAPVPIDGNLIKWSWFKFYDTPPTPGLGERLIVSWDTAMSSNQRSDYSACVVLLVRRETVYVLDVFRGRLEYPDLRRAVILGNNRWRQTPAAYSLLIERKGSGLSLIQDLRRENIHALGIDPDGDKILRMDAQTAPIEAGAVHLPLNAPWLDEFKKEILLFPNGKNDDQVDALSQGLRRAFLPKPPVAVRARYSRHGPRNF
jgi:predicted phage terminase large subunit-like protein